LIRRDELQLLLSSSCAIISNPAHMEKRMNHRKDSARSLYALAARHGVGIGEACDRAGIARSTPPRWKNGTMPRPQQLALLRKAILEIAHEKGFAPAPAADVADGGDVSRAAVLVALNALRDGVNRLEAALGLQDGSA
jgi:hypothetical protein